MFSTSGLFNNVPCPEQGRCKRVKCIFSHNSNAKQPVLPQIPVSAPVAGPSKPTSSATNNLVSHETSSPRRSIATSSTIPAKRTGLSSIKSYASTSHTLPSQEPPRKVQKLAGASNAASTAARIQTTGVPVLRTNPAKSLVPIPVRQAMLKTLYECFEELYSDILEINPTLASDDALQQEQEVYDKQATKFTYRNAMISSVASVKKRSKPTSSSHESVGTEGTLQKRRDARSKLRSLKLTSKHLSTHVMSVEELNQWGFMTEIPDGPGGTNPSEQGNLKQCERCSQQFVVKRKEDADQCVYHFGRALMKRLNGEKLREWSCCSAIAEDTPGCVRGPHVFYESSPEDLHARHAFSFTRFAEKDPDTPDTALDVVCLDCEMIYTTGGVRIARVSVVDGSGHEVFDELVKMDDGVEPIDYNTRFSGITEEEYEKGAILNLESIRRSLDAFINSNTIMIGHALENDLKALRMVHLQCVDTAILFPHRAGPPYRRALRELTRELLGRTIQTGGGTSGHSSVEDSVATLDLVRWFVLNNQGTKKSTVPQSKLSSSSVSKVT